MIVVRSESTRVEALSRSMYFSNNNIVTPTSVGFIVRIAEHRINLRNNMKVYYKTQEVFPYIKKHTVNVPQLIFFVLQKRPLHMQNSCFLLKNDTSAGKKLLGVCTPLYSSGSQPL